MIKYKNLDNLRKSIAVVMLSIFASSCSNDFLDLQPHQSIDTDMALQSIGDFQAANVGMYDGLSSSNYYGRYFVLVSDIMSDDVKQNASANRASDWAAYAGSSTDNNNLANNIWSRIYSVIDRSNRIILSETTLPPSVQDEFDNIKGQAYAVRALAHFDLVRLYAQHYTYTNDASHMGIPIVTSIDPFTKPARNSVKEVYDQIISDLQTALELVDKKKNSFFLTQSGVYGLLSRVYLYKEDWVNAVDAADQVIDSNLFSLVPNENYQAIFNTDHSSETIFEIDMHETDNRGTDALGGMYLATGYGDYLPSKDVLNLLPPNDVRNSLYITDAGLAGDYASKRVNKYDSKLGLNNIPVIRLSEVYLNRAEANAHIPGAEMAAQQDLNKIRQRALPSAPDVTATGSQLIDEILKERRVELAFEGHRLYDLTRNKKGVHRTDCTSSVCDVSYPSDRFVLAIGQAEIDVNPNVTQNPGY
ncbi:RagB/SusD family nutrient uptake outer membrane protein [Gelidibacter japonicus]|uniref:RagB/SusD family nutrient uptake outer membrane protein n=1 Tax=Gelidibacter japonicus TaxID=1962232 RepID=UPI0013D1B0A4|nr:RagB/SusD family nutrient uptake outer membrane protein [Gelidibacter japonicus]